MAITSTVMTDFLYDRTFGLEMVGAQEFAVGGALEVGWIFAYYMPLIHPSAHSLSDELMRKCLHSNSWRRGGGARLTGCMMAELSMHKGNYKKVEGKEDVVLHRSVIGGTKSKVTRLIHFRRVMQTPQRADQTEAMPVVLIRQGGGKSNQLNRIVPRLTVCAVVLNGNS